MTLDELRVLNNEPTTRKPSKFEESNIQVEFFAAVKLIFPQLDKLIFHIANEGVRNARYVKRSGLKKGVADVFLSKANKEHHGLYIEFKTLKGKQSKDQELFQSQVERVGYKYEICRSANEAINVLKEYLK